MALIEVTLTFMFSAICLTDLFGFLLTFSRIVLITFFVRAVRGLSLLGQFPKSVHYILHGGFGPF